jgi:peptidyl-prolyl cis-trans isomerase D
MLQRIHDSVGRWIALLLLGLVSVGFIFWGVDFGLNGAATFAAKVNGENLPLTEFDRELQARQNQYQQQYKIELTEDMRRELRRSVIEGMVSDAVMKQRVEEQGYRVSDARLAGFIQSAPVFQVDGRFNMDQYTVLLQNQGFTPIAFEEAQRKQMELLELQTGIADSTFFTPAEFRRFIELYNQRRAVAYAMFDVNTFIDRVAIDDAAIAAHYENNQASYQTAETVDLEYVELSLADIAATIEVTDDELRELYEQERERFATAEERRARHILIQVADGQEDAARAKAEAVVARLNNGEDFAAVASEVSEDAGTKANGGDLGWMGRSDDADPFQAALFALEQGQVSAPVRSTFGYHIIRFDELRAGQEQPFEAVRDELAGELRTREAEDRFYERAELLEERAFDAYNEIASVAAALQLPVKTVAAFPRSGDPALFPNSAPVVQAAFSEEIVDSGRNSSLVELSEGDDHVVVLRVTAHHAPTVRPLDEVRTQIADALKRERGQQLAEEAAKAFLTEVEQGADPAVSAAAHNGTWNPAAIVERTDPNVPTEVLAAAFALPKVTADTVRREEVALAGGSHAIVALSDVQPGDPSAVPQAERDAQQQQLAAQAAYAELTSYAGNLRSQATVRIPDEVLNPLY